MNVLIVDDHVLFREGLVGLLNADKYFNVVGQAGSVMRRSPGTLFTPI